MVCRILMILVVLISPCEENKTSLRPTTALIKIVCVENYCQQIKQWKNASEGKSSRSMKLPTLCSGRCSLRHLLGRHEKRWQGSRGTHACLLCPQSFSKLAYRKKRTPTGRIKLYKRCSRTQVSTPPWDEESHTAAAAVLCFDLN